MNASTYDVHICCEQPWQRARNLNHMDNKVHARAIMLSAACPYVTVEPPKHWTSDQFTHGSDADSQLARRIQGDVAIEVARKRSTSAARWFAGNTASTRAVKPHAKTKTHAANIRSLNWSLRGGRVVVVLLLLGGKKCRSQGPRTNRNPRVVPHRQLWLEKPSQRRLGTMTQALLQCG